MTQPLTYDVFISCDPSTVFDLLADLRNEKRWNKGVTTAEALDEGPVGEGSQFMTMYRGMESQSTLVEFDRPGRLTVATTTDRVDIDTAYTLAGANGGTNVTISLALRPKGVAMAFSALLRMFMRRELVSKFAAVKKACESQSGASSD